MTKSGLINDRFFVYLKPKHVDFMITQTFDRRVSNSFKKEWGVDRH